MVAGAPILRGVLKASIIEDHYPPDLLGVTNLG